MLSNLNVIIARWSCLSNDNTTLKDVKSSLGDPMCGSVMKSCEEKVRNRDRNIFKLVLRGYIEKDVSG